MRRAVPSCKSVLMAAHLAEKREGVEGRSSKWRADGERGRRRRGGKPSERGGAEGGVCEYIHQRFERLEIRALAGQQLEHRLRIGNGVACADAPLAADGILFIHGEAMGSLRTTVCCLSRCCVSRRTCCLVPDADERTLRCAGKSLSARKHRRSSNVCGGKCGRAHATMARAGETWSAVARRCVQSIARTVIVQKRKDSLYSSRRLASATHAAKRRPCRSTRGLR